MSTKMSTMTAIPATLVLTSNDLKQQADNLIGQHGLFLWMDSDFRRTYINLFDEDKIDEALYNKLVELFQNYKINSQDKNTIANRPKIIFSLLLACSDNDWFEKFLNDPIFEGGLKQLFKLNIIKNFVINLQHFTSSNFFDGEITKEDCVNKLIFIFKFWLKKLIKDEDTSTAIDLLNSILNSNLMNEEVISQFVNFVDENKLELLYSQMLVMYFETDAKYKTKKNVNEFKNIFGHLKALSSTQSTYFKTNIHLFEFLPLKEKQEVLKALVFDGKDLDLLLNKKVLEINDLPSEVKEDLSHQSEILFKHVHNESPIILEKNENESLIINESDLF